MDKRCVPFNMTVASVSIIIPDYERGRLALVGAGLCAGIFLRCRPAETPGTTGFFKAPYATAGLSGSACSENTAGKASSGTQEITLARSITR